MLSSRTAVSDRSSAHYFKGSICSISNPIDFYGLDEPNLQPKVKYYHKTFLQNNILWLHLPKPVINSTAPVSEAETLEIDVKKSEANAKIDEILVSVRYFAHLPNGWDGIGSLGAKLGVVDDAITVLQSWPLAALALCSPEPVLGCDGNIVLELFNADGLSTGGIEFIGEHLAVFSVVRGTQVLETGRFDSQIPSQILSALAIMEKAF